MPLKLKETNIVNKHNKRHNKEVDKLAIYKHDRGVELGTRGMVKAGRESATTGFQVRRPNRITTRPRCLH